MANRELPDFSSGRVVILYLTHSPGALAGGVAIEYAAFKYLGERLFVVGRSAEIHGGEWLSGLECAAAWDTVEHYVIFPTRDEFAKRMAQSNSRQSFLRRLFTS
jgi:hypothetical protein